MADLKLSLIEQYRELLKVTEDEERFILSVLKIGKIIEEMNNTADMFNEGEIDSYEGLIRLDLLLGAMGEIRDNLKKQL